MPKTSFACRECGATFPSWQGKCPRCEAWNSFEEKTVPDEKKGRKSSSVAPAFLSLGDLAKEEERKKLPTGEREIDALLGGGFPAGASFLLAGEPGVGKSTLAAQLALLLSGKGARVAIISGEESAGQVGERLQRLAFGNSQLASKKPGARCRQPIAACQLLSTNSLDDAEAALSAAPPDFAVVDSVQTLSSVDLTAPAGSPSQVREVASRLATLAGEKGFPVLLIGHLTKSGDLAGPKFLEHLVDAVLFLEGEEGEELRFLRAPKNRFGSAEETAVFSMGAGGLAPVANPSAFLLKNRRPGVPGAVVATLVENGRPLLLEIQALATRGGSGFAKRTASGFDPTRLQLLAGVLTKHAGLRLADQDIFVNVVGGFKITDRAADLAVALAIASSALGKALPEDLAVFGEVGLAGELRAARASSRRLKEARKLGFEKILAPAGVFEGKEAGVFELESIAAAVARLRG